jgi:SAM-dependent methyltransferase
MKKDVIERYNKLLEEHGDSPQALGWSKNRQKLRFKKLLDGIELGQQDTVLDFGCGFGDLYSFLKDNNYNYKSYTGIDINQKLVEMGQNKYSDIDLRVLDIFDNSSYEQLPNFDFVAASGVFNIKVENQDEFVKKSIKLLFNKTNKVLALNFLSDKVDYPTKDSFHHSPEKMISYISTLTKRYTLRNDYMPFEFTVYLYKNDQFDQNVVFHGEDYE